MERLCVVEKQDVKKKAIKGGRKKIFKSSVISTSDDYISTGSRPTVHGQILSPPTYFRDQWLSTLNFTSKVPTKHLAAMSPSSSLGGCFPIYSPLRQIITNALITLALSLATIPQLVAGQLALAGSCNVQTAQLDGNYLGMYCNNLNTASFGYNWTW